MKASNDKKVDLAREILLAYIANSPTEDRNVDSVIGAAKKIFEMVDSVVESTDENREHAGFKL